MVKLKDIAPVRAFTSAKLVNNRLFNRMGLQVARTVAARCVYNLRPTPKHEEIHDYLTALRRDGMIVIENFLDPADFELVKNECIPVITSGDERIAQRQQGPTRYEIAVLKQFPQSMFVHADRFFNDPRLLAIIEGAEKHRLNKAVAHRGIERVRQGTETTEGDPETVLHSDIFFHTHKAWLYLTDVLPKDGPLVFVKGSHLLSMKQMAEIYRHSCNPKTPSRRIEPSELEALGLKEETLLCKQNTLVVANVCGYHRRSRGEIGGERMALHCSIRSEPFFRVLEKFTRNE